MYRTSSVSKARISSSGSTAAVSPAAGATTKQTAARTPRRRGASGASATPGAATPRSPSFAPSYTLPLTVSAARSSSGSVAGARVKKEERWNKHEEAPEPVEVRLR